MRHLRSRQPRKFQRESTPLADKQTLSESYQSGSLDLATNRQFLMMDLDKSAVQVDVETFLTRLVPNVPDSLTQRVLGKLKKGNTPVISPNGRWTAFPKNPSKSKLKEGPTFEPLVGISQAIAKAAFGDSPLTTELISNPNGVPKSKNRKPNLSRPDMYFMRLLGDISWPSTSCNGELKLIANNKTILDNQTKMSWSMHQKLRDDPQSRFTFGFTIEDTDMKFWFCDRANFIVSDAFNFITEHPYVIRFFIAMLSSSETQLGWDPTMTRLPSGQFDITVRAKNGKVRIYRTVDVLADFAAESILGRATRVYKVQELKNGVPHGDFVVLKDQWIDTNRTKEGDIYTDIKNTSRSKSFQDHFKTSFLTIEWHGTVYASDDDDRLVPDDTRAVHLRGEDISATYPRFLLTRTAIPRRRRRVSHPVAAGFPFPQRVQLTKKTPDVVYEPKSHYRIVFREVCQPLCQLTDLAKIFTAILKTCKTLELLHNSGWMHQDVNLSNILIDTDGQVKLVDLEYAKKTTDDSSHRVRTLCDKFAPIEAVGRKYDFKPRRPSSITDLQSLETFDLNSAYSDTEDESDSESDGDESSENEEDNDCDSVSGESQPDLDSELPSAASHQVFRYNPLHDLESLWWLSVYFIFNHGIYIDNPDPELQLERERTAKFLLQSNRAETLKNGDILLDAVEKLPASLRFSGEVLDVARQYLVDRFRAAEATTDCLPHLLADGLHDKLAGCFGRVRKSVKKIKIYPVPMVRGNIELAAAPPKPSTLSPRKRSRSNLQSEDEDDQPRRKRRAVRQT